MKGYTSVDMMIPPGNYDSCFQSLNHVVNGVVHVTMVTKTENLFQNLNKETKTWSSSENETSRDSSSCLGDEGLSATSHSRGLHYLSH